MVGFVRVTSREENVMPVRNGRRVAIVAGCRTPFCRAGTSLKDARAVDLARFVARELLERTSLDGAAVDAVIFGQVVPSALVPNVAREVSLLPQFPREIPAYSLNRACASSAQAVANAHDEIALGDADVVLAGGVESLSDIPILASRRLADILVEASKAKTLGARLRTFSRIRPRDLVPVSPAIAEPSTGETMGQSAEKMAKQNHIARDAQDRWALRSHELAARGTDDGRLTAEIAPWFPERPAEPVLTTDNGIRRDTSLEQMAKLRPVFDRQYGSVTAANSSPLTDGASAVLVMSDEAARALGYTPLAYVRSYAVAAVDPGWQLLQAPIFAVPAALTWELADGIAVVTFDLAGEPVNKISRVVKQDVLATFEALERDAAVQAVAFFSGKPENFIAGADIEEFVALTSAAEAERLSADGQDLLERVARFPKPVAVGIHGACLGGGLEFALACRYRVASDHPKTQLGLPEVQLGILPGASGCQRLPRLIGARAALDIILAGRSERAPKAFRLGMVDELVHPAILQDITIAAARRLADGWRPRRRRPGGVLAWLLDRNPLGRRLVFRTARRQVLERTKGHYPAPLAALEAVEHGLKHGMAEGLKREARLFGQLAVTDVSRKLVQIFFATTQLKKDFGLPNAPPPTAVQRLAIVGAGFMGSGIAGTAIVQAGVDVRMKDADLPRVAKGLAAARALLDDRLRRRRIAKYEYARLAALLSGGDGYAGFGRADLVIEAVFEDLSVKQQVLREVEAAARDDAVFASNTSTIPIARIAEAARRPERVIGMHFFSPVDRMPLLEVIPAARTAPGVVSTAVGFGRRLGKTVIVVKDSPGFWVNRILAPYANEVGHLLAEGASIEEIDAAAVGFGFPVGPVTLLDEVGLDVAEKVSQVMGAAFGERLQATAGVAALVKAGRLGRKSGRGFYRYGGGKKRGVDPAVYELLGVHPNGGPRLADILQRLVDGMLNEAARAVGDGVVRTPRDGDIGAIFGFGFPPFRGGPLRHADDLGAARIVGELERLAERYGPRFAPSEALRDQAAQGGKFYP